MNLKGRSMTGHVVSISDQLMSRHEISMSKTCNTISSLITEKCVFYIHDRTSGCMSRQMNNNVDEIVIQMVPSSSL